MIATEVNELSQVVEGLEALMREAVSQSSAEGFATLEQQVARFDSTLRELQQVHLRNHTKAVIARLRKREPVSAEDEAVIRAMIVGDAEYYLKHENNLQDWLAELKRLTGEMQRLSRGVSDRTLGDLRGVVKDAVRLIPNIRAYMEEKARLDQFNDALRRLDNGNRALLIDLLREQLDSPTR